MLTVNIMASEYEIEFKIPLTRHICGVLLTRLIKTLLFIKGQIPCSYEEMEKIVEASSTTPRRLEAGPLKKSKRFYEKSEVLFNALITKAFNSRVYKVVLIFGAAITCPMEQISVEFSYQDRGNETPQIVEQCQQKLIRQLITTAQTLFEKPIRPTGFHLAILADQLVCPSDLFVPAQELNFKRQMNCCLKISGTEPRIAVEGNENQKIWYKLKQPLRGFS